MRNKYFIRNWLAIFFGAVGSQAMYILLSNYSLIFFTDFLGISAGTAGTVFMLSRAWDAVNDPMCGAIVDKTETRFGKTQPFILGGGLVSAIFLIVFFTIPNLSLIGRTAWGTISYNMVGMAFTAVTVGTLVQMPRASKDQKERVNLSAAYSVGCAIAGIVAAAAVVKGLLIFGKSAPAKGYQIVAILSAVIGFAFLAGNVVLYKEQAEDEIEKAEKPKVLKIVKAVLRTPPFRILILTGFLWNMGYGISAGAMIYYATYVLNDPGLVQVLLPLMYIGTFVSSLTAGYMVRFGRNNMCKIGLLVMALGYVARIITGDANGTLICIFYLIANIGCGYMSTYLPTMLMDCADYAEYTTGVKCEAFTMTGFTLCTKMAAGIGTAVLGFALQAAGYNGQAAEQAASAVGMIRIMHLYAVPILSGIGVVLLLFFKLDADTMKKIMAKKNGNKDNNG